MLQRASGVHDYTHFSHFLFLSLLFPISQSYPYLSFVLNFFPFLFYSSVNSSHSSLTVFIFLSDLELVRKRSSITLSSLLKYPPILHSITQNVRKESGWRRGRLERRDRGIENPKREEDRMGC